MKAVILTTLLLAGMPVVATAAENPSLAGSWRLDLERSDPRRQGQPLAQAEMSLVLIGDDVRATRTYEGGFSFTLDYVTDGKPHDVETPMGSQTVRARWKKDRLFLSYSISRATPRGAFEMDVTETWRLKNGELEVGFSTRVGDRSLTRKEIWIRASP